MKITTGSYVGNGSGRTISAPNGDAVFFMANAAQHAAFHLPTMWTSRTNNLGATDSFVQGARLTERGVAVGSEARVNGSGTTTHYAVLSKTPSADFDVMSAIGNATAGTVIRTPQNKKVAAVIIKRDSARSGVIATDKTAAAAMDGATAGTFVTALGTGSITIGSENNVNEMDGPGGLGEGVEYLVFYASDNVVTATWQGGQQAGYVAATAPAGKTAKMAITFIVGTGSASARVITDTMATSTKPATTSAFQSNELTLSNGQLALGASGSAMNQVGVTYGAVLLCDDALEVNAPRVIRSRGNQVVSLSGTGSYVDCGNADGNLMLTGAMSYEWVGAIAPTAAQNTECPLLMRYGGSFQAANSASWGVTCYRSADGTFAWAGPQFNCVVGDRLINAGIDIRYGWRTGILTPWGRLFAVHAVHEGNGDWYLYLNGVLVKQRRINLVTALGVANIASTSGHRTSIGARWNGSAFAANNKLMHRVGRVHNVALTADEVAQRVERVMYGSKAADVTRGLAEEWDANNARGLSLPATVNSANNGAITNGSVLVL